MQRRITIRKETFELLETTSAAIPAWDFEVDFIDEGNGYISFEISDEVAAQLRAVDADPETAILALVKKGGKS